jgi:nitrite reductase/ring-hydroxylating ferredoxin subunit
MNDPNTPTSSPCQGQCHDANGQPPPAAAVPAQAAAPAVAAPAPVAAQPPAPAAPAINPLPGTPTPVAQPAVAEPVWTAVGNAADWPLSGGRLVKLGARRIGVYRHAGKWYALKDYCPHAGVSLVAGPVHEAQVMCVGHGWMFSLEDGRCTRGAPGMRTATYPAREVAGVVEIAV